MFMFAGADGLAALGVVIGGVLTKTRTDSHEPAPSPFADAEAGE